MTSNVSTSLHIKSLVGDGMVFQNAFFTIKMSNLTRAKEWGIDMLMIYIYTYIFTIIYVFVLFLFITLYSINGFGLSPSIARLNAKDLKLWLSMKLSHQVCRPMSECCWWLRADRFGQPFVDFLLWSNLKFPVYCTFVFL